MTNNSRAPNARLPVAIFQRSAMTCCSDICSSSLEILERYSGPRSGGGGGGSSKNQPACVFGENSISSPAMRMRCFIVDVGMGRRPALVVSADLQQGLMPLAAFVEELAA